ncbi:CDP-glucose 4,6-dehydratase [uncultured Cohaesibacter sp.]|uniref:CDP-glucose 4,6-dehydratase n=1 Tax=uncultured Cohaesibacter sp. TaxID=1002546 RepID=UPI0029C672D1|nr:CDP-glucose 4,6-dehydratase [uncultured Cohaesibacter sp.]
MVKRQCTMENLELISFWGNKKVLVTGHTGFKGSWLSLWLSELNARLYGYALAPEKDQPLLEQFHLPERMSHKTGDIRDLDSLRDHIRQIRPDVIFHLAAQSLVLRGYEQTPQTWATNLLGTVNLLEALRDIDHPTVVIIITTDKVYQNREWVHPYRETDRLGGLDPYSASKAGAELAIASYRHILAREAPHVRVASARAGNVIGGGDWSDNRLFPDIARALIAQTPIEIRNPFAIRPWQHVLEPLQGYLMLTEKLSQDPALATSFNFGPYADSHRTVEEVIQTCLKYWPGSYVTNRDANAPHEASILKLSIDKAICELGWHPKWTFEETIDKSISWYRDVDRGADPQTLALDQISEYSCR